MHTRSSDTRGGETYPRFIFIAGTPRSGGNVTLGSLDGHPDILAWPYEFTYFPFFRQIAGKRDKVPASELSKELIKTSFQYFSKRLAHGGSIYDPDDRKPAMNDNFNIGGLDYQLFLKGINSINEKKVSPVEYLTHLFDCLKQAHSAYRDRPVKYYLLLTTARSFDWNDKNLMNSSMVLYSYRDAEESYSSIREKYITTLGMNVFFRPDGKKSLLYWLENYRRISKSAEQYINRDNFIVVALKDLQKDSEKELRRICSFLKIGPDPNIFNLTILGSPYKGNAREGELNTGKIAKRTSKPRTPLCSFEQKIFGLLDLFDFPNNKKRVFPAFGFIEMTRSVFTSAFREIPGDKIWNGGTRSPLNTFVGRVIIFGKFFGTYLAVKNKQLALALIRKGNKHMMNNPFWN